MSLRRSTIITISLTLLSLIVILYVFTSTVVWKNFAMLEEHYTMKFIERGMDTIENEIHSIDNINHDWSSCSIRRSIYASLAAVYAPLPHPLTVSRKAQ